jgi:hypothetical protein
MNCPYCNNNISRFIASYAGSIKTSKKATASRKNGKLGGRPRKGENNAK